MSLKEEKSGCRGLLISMKNGEHLSLKQMHALRPEHIEAALAYAAELAHEERLIPLQVR